MAVDDTSAPSSSLNTSMTVLHEVICKDIPEVSLRELKDGSIWNRVDGNRDCFLCCVRAQVQSFWPKDVRDFSVPRIAFNADVKEGSIKSGPVMSDETSFTFHVMLQLVDASSPEVTIEVSLCNRQAENFFRDVPAQNLRLSKNRVFADKIASGMRKLMRVDTSRELQLFAIKVYRTE